MYPLAVPNMLDISCLPGGGVPDCGGGDLRGKYLGQYLREFDWRYNVRKVPDVERAVIVLKMVGGKRLMLKPSQSNDKSCMM